MTNNISFVTDAHGRFYAGMSLNEAQINGTDKSFFHRDFHNLDKNKDGVLSVKEIMDERKRSSFIDKCIAGIFGAIAVGDFMMDRGSKGWMAFDVLINGYIIISSIMSAYKTDKGTERIEKELLEKGKSKIELNA